MGRSMNGGVSTNVRSIMENLMKIDDDLGISMDIMKPPHSTESGLIGDHTIVITSDEW